MDHRQVWERYALSWKVTTAEEKRALYAESLSPECVYTDPMQRCAGFEELEAYMLAFHQQIPGGHFVTRRFRTHHDKSIAEWDMCGADGQVLGDGVSFGEYDAQGRLLRMTGFFDVPDPQ